MLQKPDENLCIPSEGPGMDLGDLLQILGQLGLCSPKVHKAELPQALKPNYLCRTVTMSIEPCCGACSCFTVLALASHFVSTLPLSASRLAQRLAFVGPM